VSVVGAWKSRFAALEQTKNIRIKESRLAWEGTYLRPFGTESDHAMTDEPKYDAAISFLAKDEATAKGLADRLESSGLKVFFFPRNQEELAGPTAWNQCGCLS
jgi:hypothetical protein